LVGSLLVSVTFTPAAGAPTVKPTANVWDWPGAMVTLDGKVMAPISATVMLAVVSATFGKALA
jgi:hypothetical protein